MQETQLLNKTLELYQSVGITGAYDYLLGNLRKLDVLSSQVYNFLYCLAAISEKRDEALDWLEEAIVHKGMWYRPDVFDDHDLDNIRDSARFVNYCQVSNERYLVALQDARPVCTWQEKRARNLLLVLHGNQQNLAICKEYWDALSSKDDQIEYLQSRELDSMGFFRWEDEGDGPTQLKEAIEAISWNSYVDRILCGFSAGCNVILRAIAEKEISCEKIVLQSPWIPVVDTGMNRVVSELKNKKIQTLIICGEDDEDCLPPSQELAKQLGKAGAECQTVFVKGLAHEYPSQFGEIVSGFLQNKGPANSVRAL